MTFFQRVNYAASHEDGRSELLALALTPSSRAVCITGSGSRVLDLLIAGPVEIVAVDFNPAQNRLLELKTASMRALDYQEFARFIGLSTSSSRRELYLRVRDELPFASQSFWDSRIRDIERGILYSGRWERFLRLMVTPAAWARRRLVQRIFECDTLEQQASLWLEEWDTPSWRRYLTMLSSRNVWSGLVREPGMRHIPRSLDIGACIRERFNQAAQSFLFRESAWAWLVFFGLIPEEGPLPPHLDPEHFEMIASNSKKIRVVDAGLEEFLTTCAPRHFDAFSVSDFGSYADNRTYQSTWRAIDRTAAEGARVCERQFLVPRDPLHIEGLQMARRPELEAELRTQDTSVVYDFIATTKQAPQVSVGLPSPGTGDKPWREARRAAPA